MRTLETKLNLTETIEISTEEAELIMHLTSYNLTKSFASVCSTQYSEERLKAVLDPLHQRCQRIVQMHQAAHKAIAELRKEHKLVRVADEKGGG